MLKVLPYVFIGSGIIALLTGDCDLRACIVVIAIGAIWLFFRNGGTTNIPTNNVTASESNTTGNNVGTGGSNNTGSSANNRCNNCGNPIEEDAVYCANCGYKVI